MLVIRILLIPNRLLSTRITKGTGTYDMFDASWETASSI